MKSRYLPATDLTLLSLTEVLGGILWVWLPWLGINEVPSANTLIGGAIIISAIISLSLKKSLTETSAELRLKVKNKYRLKIIFFVICLYVVESVIICFLNKIAIFYCFYLKHVNVREKCTIYFFLLKSKGLLTFGGLI